MKILCFFGLVKILKKENEHEICGKSKFFYGKSMNELEKYKLF